MKAIVCDKCKKPFEPKETKFIRINQMGSISSFDGGNTESFEVCEECYKHIFAEIKNVT